MKENILGDFTQSPSLLPEVYNDAYTSALCGADTLHDGKDKIWLASYSISHGKTYLSRTKG